ncbi:hypothetical protein GACE_2286 [Geoglobus acetivorans]|uniref:Uncharacterized protein n=1 Tax=Geoglobus acetivorans TaxID=565033 RepID=A0A0A7GH95_GEOAI|nr:hypothetical protein GACE_2286 [Geoglobus acetivorans]
MTLRHSSVPIPQPLETAIHSRTPVLVDVCGRNCLFEK